MIPDRATKAVHARTREYTLRRRQRRIERRLPPARYRADRTSRFKGLSSRARGGRRSDPEPSWRRGSNAKIMRPVNRKLLDIGDKISRARTIYLLRYRSAVLNTKRVCIVMYACSIVPFPIFAHANYSSRIRSIFDDLPRSPMTNTHILFANFYLGPTTKMYDSFSREIRFWIKIVGTG